MMPAHWAVIRSSNVAYTDKTSKTYNSVLRVYQPVSGTTWRYRRPDRLRMCTRQETEEMSKRLLQPPKIQTPNFFGYVSERQIRYRALNAYRSTLKNCLPPICSLRIK